ncbi:uncharacterized protein LOC121426446 [Lytechinus variegatus]|uniref:uncharacterized protein LOC121426446 n=1 Tax=Lytechinus variegatus TaxID=7654 RepID=UPI001BB14968|nr:uncharacterized protein LOC121426446 [Lytechinus variegatus]
MDIWVVHAKWRNMTRMDSSIDGVSIQVRWRPFFLAFILPILFSASFGQVSCPNDWIIRSRYCYKLYNESLSWQLARSQCKFDGGFLTSIVNRQENDLLVAMFKDLTSLAWIGMDSTGRWLDGSSSETFYNGFRYETLSTSMCSVIDLERNGIWNVSDCLDSRLKFICKIDKDRPDETPFLPPTPPEDNDDDDGDDYYDYYGLYPPGAPWDAERITLVVVPLLVVLGIILFICSGPKRCERLLTSIGNCLCDSPGRLWGCISRELAQIYEWLCVLGRAIQSCFAYIYRCATCREMRRKRRERRERTPSRDPESQEPLNQGPVTRGRTDQNQQPSINPSAPPYEPPARVGNVTSDRSLPMLSRMTPTAPPPSSPLSRGDRTAPPAYGNAMDSKFDLRPTDNLDETTPAPSYESVSRL